VSDPSYLAPTPPPFECARTRNVYWLPWNPSAVAVPALFVAVTAFIGNQPWLDVLSYCWTSNEAAEQLPAVIGTLNSVVDCVAATLTVTAHEKYVFSAPHSSGAPPP